MDSSSKVNFPLPPRPASQPPKHHRGILTTTAPLAQRLQKAKSWSPDIQREEAWEKRKEIHLKRRKECSSSSTNNKSLTDSELEELKGCFDLGFSFDSSSKLDKKLTQTFPALEFYCNVLNNKLPNKISRSTSLPTFTNNHLSPNISPKSIIQPGDDPEMVKMRLKHWAQVVACSLHMRSSK